MGPVTISEGLIVTRAIADTFGDVRLIQGGIRL
jgi:hypothetical protein